MFWLGVLILILTFAAIIKRYETRLVLFTSGVCMAVISGRANEAVTAFTKAMVQDSLVPIICTVMGFAFVMKYTKCDAHMIHWLAGSMTRARAALIPMSALLTFLVAIALPSAAGCAAAVGSLLIPTMTASGIHPAVAASAIMVGTYGSVLNPGNAQTVFVAELAGVDVMTVLAAGQGLAAILCGLVGALSLYFVAVWRREHKGYALAPGAAQAAADFKINYVRALVPALPLAILLLGSKQLQILPPVSVPQAMIFGAIAGLIVTRCNPQELTKAFFDGLGSAYGGIIGLIASAAVFTQGMALIGITGELIEIMKGSDQVAMFAAGFGPMIVAILSGSGDAATLAFNGAITPHAEAFGYAITDMGSLAFLSGAFGRTMSPVAGAAIICAQLARVDPIEVTKRNAVGMILAAFTAMFALA